MLQNCGLRSNGGRFVRAPDIRPSMFNRVEVNKTQMTSNPAKISFGLCVLIAMTASLHASHVWGQSVGIESQTEVNSSAEATPTTVAVASIKEQKVKAAYLYNFSRYFEWPANTFDDVQEPFVIGVLGADPLGNQLDRLAAKKTVRKRKIEIQRFLSTEQLDDCHVLFVTRSVSDEQFQEALTVANASHVLVVSERPPETRVGSSIQIFVDEAGKIGFEIDVEVVNALSLQVSAKLLKLARVPSQSKK